MAKRMDVRVIAAIAISQILWASAYAGIRAALPAYSPPHLALLRFLIASAALGCYAIVTRSIRLPRKRDLPGIVLAGFFGIVIDHLALNYGELHVAAGAASMLMNITPIFTGLWATFFLREQLNHRGWLGIAVCVFGTVLITMGEGHGWHLNMSTLIVLVGAVASSVFFVLQKPYLKRYSGFEFTCYSIWAGTLFLLFSAPGLLTQVRMAPMSATLSVVYLGLFPAALAYVLWAYFLARTPASRAATYLYLAAPLGFIIAWFWLHEIPTTLSILGALLTLVGIVLTNGKRRREVEEIALPERVPETALHKEPEKTPQKAA